MRQRGDVHEIIEFSYSLDTLVISMCTTMQFFLYRIKLTEKGYTYSHRRKYGSTSHTSQYLKNSSSHQKIQLQQISPEQPWLWSPQAQINPLWTVKTRDSSWKPQQGQESQIQPCPTNYLLLPPGIKQRHSFQILQTMPEVPDILWRTPIPKSTYANRGDQIILSI